jgi:HK97 family phage portal protein
MGIRDGFKLLTTADLLAAQQTADVVTASLSPVWNPESLYQYASTTPIVTREASMSVPAVARARNLLCGTAAGMERVLRDKRTGAKIEPMPAVFNQPDRRVAGSVTFAWTIEDLIFYGKSYWRVKSLYAETNRIKEAERIQPERVDVKLNALGTEIIEYRVDGKAVPTQGVGSLVTFWSYNEGLLSVAGRTILSAIELEKTALNYAREPMPQVTLKSNGSILPKERIQALLDAWSASRKNRATAFLNADISFEQLGFDPERLQLNAARQYIALEIARATNVPAYYLSAESLSSNLTYSNTIQERRALIDFSLAPIIHAIEERLSMPDFVPSGQIVKFDLDVFLRADIETRVNTYKTLVEIGAMTPEEVRQQEEFLS